MLMKGPNGPFTVPLLARNNKLTVTVGEHDVQLTASIERWFVYHLYVGEGKGIVIRWFREVQYISCLPHEYDAFISLFIQQHPKTAVENYSLDIIPMQSDGKNGLALPIPYYECIISEDAERELLNLFIKSKKKYQARIRLVKWIKQYCEDYGYCFPQCEGKEYEYLYNAFLEQHGISTYAIRELEEAENPTTLEKKSKNKKRNIWKSILRATVLIGGYAFVMWLLSKGIDCDALHDSDVLIDGQFICMLVFFLMLGGLIYLFLFPICARNDNEVNEAVGVWRAIIAFIVHGFKEDDK